MCFGTLHEILSTQGYTGWVSNVALAKSPLRPGACTMQLSCVFGSGVFGLREFDAIRVVWCLRERRLTVRVRVLWSLLERRLGLLRS